MGADASPLEKLFTLCQEGKPWRICLWDWAGITRSRPELSLDFDRYQVHQSPFCQYAKSTPAGLKRCLRCRQGAGFQALRRGAFQGRCHLGLTEIVHPIRMGEQVLGILYGGQVLGPGSRGRFEKGAWQRWARATGLDARRLAVISRKMPKVKQAGVEELKARLELVASFITSHLSADPGLSLSGKMARPPERQELPSMRGRSRRIWLAKSAVEIARLEYHKPLGTTQVARRLGVALSVFCRSFREHSGRNFKDFLQEQRIKAAERLLIESESGVAYIASEVGFKDPNFFSRAFKARNRLSPSEFREKHWKIKALK